MTDKTPLCATKEELLEFVRMQKPNEWCGNYPFPEPRYPIMAIVRIGGEFDDDMDIGDEDMEESIIENNGRFVPICGVSYDSMGSGIVITPFSTSASDKCNSVMFISWDRVYEWRYLTEKEGLFKWQALMNELPKKSEVTE